MAHLGTLIRAVPSIGFASGFNFQTGSDYNTLLGFQSGYNITTGAHNIQLGYQSTNGGISTGSYNILLGDDVRYDFGSATSNQLNIGNLLFSQGVGTGNTLATGSLGIASSTPAHLVWGWANGTGHA